jgi:hypothetical protein
MAAVWYVSRGRWEMGSDEITRRLVAIDTMIGQFARDTRETAAARRHLTEARLWWQEHLVKEAGGAVQEDGVVG